MRLAYFTSRKNQPDFKTYLRRTVAMRNAHENERTAARTAGTVLAVAIAQYLVAFYSWSLVRDRQLTRHCGISVSDCNARFLNVDVISYATQAELGGTAGSRKTFGGMPARLHVMCAR